MAQALVGKWGNNLAVRLPGEIVRAARLRDGERIEIEAQADTIVIRRLEPAVTLESLFQGKTPEEWRAAYSGAYDWGPDIGGEIVEE
jgi:antitoxin component of MazEF toxin-antitoxin module